MPYAQNPAHSGYPAAPGQFAPAPVVSMSETLRQIHRQFPELSGSDAELAQIVAAVATILGHEPPAERRMRRPRDAVSVRSTRPDW